MFALINRDLTNILKRREQVDIVHRDKLHSAKPYWVPMVIEIIDTSITSEKIIGPWVETIEVDRVLRIRTIRDKTQVELNTEDTEKVNRLMSVSGIDLALAKALFELVNDVRDLRKQNPMNVNQFKNYLKGLIR